MAKLLYQGHGSLRLTTDSGKIIFIDPFAGEGYEVPADLILVTHQHHDHNCIDLPAKNPDCVIWQNFDALKEGKYQTLTLDFAVVEAVEAYNHHHNKHYVLLNKYRDYTFLFSMFHKQKHVPLMRCTTCHFNIILCCHNGFNSCD